MGKVWGVKVSFSGTFMAFNVPGNMSQENVGHCWSLQVLTW